MGHQKCGSGAGNSTEFHQSCREDPPLRDAGQQKKNSVALSDPTGIQHICRLIGKTGKICKGKAFLCTFLIYPNHGNSVRIFSCIAVDHIVCTVTILRNIQAPTADRQRGCDLVATTVITHYLLHIMFFIFLQ